MKNLDDMQKVGKNSMDVAMNSFGEVTKNAQAIAVEMADYSKRSFETSTQAFEQMLGAKSIDKVLEIQTSYAKTAYESFLAEANKMSELYADFAKQAYKPYEGYLGKLNGGK